MIRMVISVMYHFNTTTWSFFEVTEENFEIYFLGKPFIDFSAAAFIS
jgi:hypothetical protein